MVLSLGGSRGQDNSDPGLTATLLYIANRETDADGDRRLICLPSCQSSVKHCNVQRGVQEFEQTDAPSTGGSSSLD